MSRLKLLSILLISSALSSSCGPGEESSTAASKSENGTSSPQPVQVAKVTSQRLSMSIRLPGELQPYEVVGIYPKVTGLVDWIGVDRGSRVRSGQQIIRLVAPELTAQRLEGQAKLQTAEAQRVEAEAKLAADQSIYQRLKSAAAPPGVVAGNDLEIALQAAGADRARVRAAEDGTNARGYSRSSTA